MSASARQYFFLVCRSYDESTQPVKCFLQKHEAITFGKRLASKEEDDNISYELYRQEITRAGQFEFVKTLTPFKDISKLKPSVLEPFDWSEFDNLGVLGADTDIDLRR